MAMPAGLIAFAADIDLESLQRATSQGQAMAAQLLIKCIRAHVWCNRGQALYQSDGRYDSGKIDGMAGLRGIRQEKNFALKSFTVGPPIACRYRFQANQAPDAPGAGKRSNVESTAT